MQNWSSPGADEETRRKQKSLQNYSVLVANNFFYITVNYPKKKRGAGVEPLSYIFWTIRGKNPILQLLLRRTWLVAFPRLDGLEPLSYCIYFFQQDLLLKHYESNAYDVKTMC